MDPHDLTTRKERRSGEALELRKGGAFVKWSSIIGGALVSLGAAASYADARWSATESALRATCDRALVLEQQMAAAQRTADERHTDLKAQLAQIQAQLAAIQADLRRSGR